jgi:hypothetical protein
VSAVSNEYVELCTNKIELFSQIKRAKFLKDGEIFKKFWPLQSSWKKGNLMTGQCFGSGLDPNSIRSVDPNQDSESGFGSRRAKMTQKI